ncbi:hypothetical protein FQN54_005065 [Arachnomyces sp. PD_36]|nr:hypothetical protein FQN54_005065 [Arachnomyces sp. PD_36]
MDVTMGDAASADHAPGGQPPAPRTAPNPHNPHTIANPYEADPAKLPPNDFHLLKSPNYGRYLPRPDDFTPDPRYTGFGDESNVEYWKGILARCDNTTRIQQAFLARREVHAIGGMIIKFKPSSPDTTGESGTCLFDENEREAMVTASDALGDDIQIPSIYFIGRVGDVDLLVQSRIPGVTLEAAWPYLSAEQKEDFKQQTRRILKRFVSISPPSSEGITEPAYIYADCANARRQRRFGQLEYDLLLMDDNSDDFSFMHNDLVPSKIVINDGKIVGIIGWGQSGWFGLYRARNVHRQIRSPKEISSDTQAEGFGVGDLWTDLYDIEIDRPRPAVKTESLLPSLEKVPTTASVDGELPTPKKIADLKRGSISRASSSERSSPVAPNKTAAANKRTAKKPETKKPVASRKPAPKKRKVGSLDSDSKDAAGRSGTPASSRASRTPAPGPKNAVEEDEVEEDGEGGDDVEDEDDGIFCICRRPDNHTWMIGCDGGCEDWFHGACVKINKADADLIDKYICPNCEESGKGHTTWKPMCRLPSCRQPARLKLKELSKYCSDAHGREFMRIKTQGLKAGESTSPAPATGRHRSARELSSAAARKGRKSAHTESQHTEDSHDEDYDVDMDDAETEEREELEDLGSRGGVLTGPDLKAAISGVKSAKEFRELGENNTGPGADDKADAEQDKKFWFPYESKEDFMDKHPKLKVEDEKLEERRRLCSARSDLLANREKFLVLVRQRVKVVLEKLRKADPKGGWKDICGYDSRVAWSDEEFDEWAKTDEGVKALRDGDLEALLPSGADGDTAMRDDEAGSVDAISRGICTKKRCERHKQWAKVEQQNIALEQGSAEEDWRVQKDDTANFMKVLAREIAGKAGMVDGGHGEVESANAADAKARGGEGVQKK